jgi:hypothetical protein
MRFARLAKKNNAFEEFYEQEVVNRIRKKYSINQELAILRQRDTKPEEFAEYNDFVEKVKAEIKEKAQGGDSE